MDKRQVVLLGNSVFLAGARASLCREPDLAVVQIDTSFAEIEERLAQLDTSFLIFDQAAIDSDLALRFLANHPSLKLIGLDTARNVVTIYSSERLRELTFTDLAQIIRQ